eukprot:jgi/Ulvmu1/343/UM001_0347.1
MADASTIVSECVPLGIDELEQVVHGIFGTISRRYSYAKAVQVFGKALATPSITRNDVDASPSPSGHSYRRSTTTLLPVAPPPRVPTDDNDPESYSLSGAATPMLVPAPAPTPSSEDGAPLSAAPAAHFRPSLDPADAPALSPLHPGAPSPAHPPRRLLRQLTKEDTSRNRWKRAVKLVCERITAAADPWAARGLHLLPVLRGRRRRYSAHSKRWTEDEVLAKMEVRPFANGSMRQCYAMKKLSTFSAFRSWLLAGNFVAKVYMNAAEEEAYVDDVQLQMEAKRFGDAYNAQNPPKKVDIMACCLVQFPELPVPNLFCVENAIEGDYVKYNSNSGFVNVADVQLRNTPQAFSHFSFEHSAGAALVVDIQGVGDIYTDPQIHTLDGQGFGTGNLGLRGMAMFFRTHECNDLCRKLGLHEFERCEVDQAGQGYSSSSSSNRQATLFQRRRATRPSGDAPGAPAAQPPRVLPVPEGRVPTAAVLRHLERVPPRAPSPLARVHLSVSRLYAEVVLLPDLQPQEDPGDALKAAIFHLRYAAMQGVPYALLALAKMHAGLEPGLAPFAAISKAGAKAGLLWEDGAVADRLFELAAERGVRGAAVALATAAAAGTRVGGAPRDPPDADGAAAAQWFARAVDMELGDPVDEEEMIGFVGNLLADGFRLQAEYGTLLLRGALGLPPAPERAAELLLAAAEAAAAAMKGKLSLRYTELAAEAEAMIPEEG